MKPALVAALVALVPILPAKLPGLGPGAEKAFDSAFALCQEGKLPAALRQYERAVELAPDSQDVWMEYTVCLRKAGRLQRAARAGWRTLELGPATAGMWGNLGNVFVQAQEWGPAKAAFRQAAKLSADKRWAIRNSLNLGYRQWINGQADLALTTFDDALRLDPTNGQALLDIGLVLGSQGKRDEATKTLERALAIVRTEGNRSAVALGEDALEAIRREGVLRVPLSVDSSFQKLPGHLLAQPAQGKALSSAVDAAVEKLYRLPPARILSVRLPETWAEAVEPSSARQPFTVTYEPAGAATRRLMWTPFSRRRPAAEIKSEVSARGDRLLPGAVEKKLGLIEVKSGTVMGYAFFLTDRSSVARPPTEGDYPYMSQGIMQAGDAEVRFRLLSVARDQRLFEEMFAVLKGFTPKSPRRTRALPAPGAARTPDWSRASAGFPSSIDRRGIGC